MIEYQQGVRGGRVVDEDGYAGARGAVVRSRSRFEEIRPAVEELAAERAAAISRAYARLDRLIAERAEAGRVREAVVGLRRLLES